MRKWTIFTVLIVIVLFMCTIRVSKDDNYIDNKKERELFSEYYDEAEFLLDKMTLEEKVGQLFLVRYHDNANEEIEQEKPGGYILFGKDFEGETIESEITKISDNQSRSKVRIIYWS